MVKGKDGTKEKGTSKGQVISLLPDKEGVARPRLRKLIIKNFRTIGKNPVEIDLDTVIDSLERLSKKERVIGLIRHVPELRSRIARRLIVDPPSSQGEGSRVRLGKA